MIKSRDRLELIADDGGGGAKMQRREKKSRLVQNYFEKGKGAGELSYDQADGDSCCTLSNKKDLQWIPMQKVRSSGSYPDLLEMVTRSGSPSSRDHAGMYAKVGGMSMYAKVRW